MSAPRSEEDWSRLCADLRTTRIGDATGARVEAPRTRTLDVPAPAAFMHVIATIAERHHVTPVSLLLAAQLALVSRYVGSQLRVQATARTRALLGGVPAPAALWTIDMMVGDNDTLDMLAQQLVELAKHEPVNDADAAASPSLAPIVLDVCHTSDEPSERPEGSLDLVFSTRTREDGAVVTLAQDAERFFPETLQSVAHTLAEYLRQLAADPTQALARVPVLDEATQQLVLHQWNQRAVPRARDELVHHALERLAAERPDAVVAELGSRTITARELNNQANALAVKLVAARVGKNAPVGVAMERSLELLVALFAVLKSGSAFVALDPDLPADRLSYVLTDAQAPLVLTQTHLAQTIRGAAALANATVLALPSTAGMRRAPTVANPSRGTTPAQPAYIVYTSGSTGRPKGVRVPHRALVNHAHWFAQTVGLTSTDRVLQYASISFDASLAELFAPVVARARIVLAAPHAHRDLLGLFDTVQRAEITVLQAVPSVLRAALAGGAFDQQVTQLRYLVSGGEALDHALINALRARLPNVRIGNFYGPSEACVDATMMEVTESTLDRHTIPIGRPVANARCHILDRFAQPVPIGAMGMLHIGGIGLALDYQAQPTLTERRFVADPFRAGERLYRSGDLARYAADGTIEYLGRADTQVKIRGYRLELAEIETALLQFPGLLQAAVVARDDADGERTLVAWLVAEEAHTHAAPLTIATRLRQILPSYIVPSHIGFVKELPITSNGKLDRRAVEAWPIPSPVDTGDDSPREAIVGPISRRLVPIWERVLGVSPIGLDDAFFDLGGHSLKAIRLLNEVEREFGVDIGAGVLFESPTIRELTVRLHDRKPKPVATTIPVQPRGTKPPLFFVPGGGGELFVFEALAKSLGRDQPLYVIDLYAFGARAELSPEPSLAEIVRCILSDMRHVQPEGPYHIAGYSMGGNIALEIAQQLRASGDAVGMLLLLDADGPNYPILEPLPTRLLTHVRHAIALGPRGMARYVRDRLPRVARRIGLAAAERHRLFAQEADLALVPPEVIARMERALAPLIVATERYVPQPYAGDVTLIRADVRQPMVGVRDTDLKLGWGPILPALRTVALPCGHFDLLRAPYAPRLAEIIVAQLRAP